MIVVGLTGKAGVGKDTVGDYLIEQYGFKKESFAAPLKRLVGDIFGVTENLLNPVTQEDRDLREQPLDGWGDWSARGLLQYIGTEMFRTHIDKDVWVKSLANRIAYCGDERYVITDIRFPNELDIFKEKFDDNFVSITIKRSGCDGNTSGGIKAHASESHDFETDHIVHNDGTFEDLYEILDNIISRSLVTV